MCVLTAVPGGQARVASAAAAPLMGFAQRLVRAAHAGKRKVQPAGVPWL
jgi:hypothetical protein